MKNNYDQSSTGLNIELSIFKDTDQSMRDFKECFNIMQTEGYRSFIIAEFLDYGNFSGGFSFADFSEYVITVKGLHNALLSGANIADLNCESKKLFGKTLKQLTKTELIEFTENWLYYSEAIAEFLQDNFKPLYSKLATRGHCQNDYAEVIFSNKFKEYWKKETKKDFSESDFSDMVDQLFWDSPIYGQLTVNENEFYLDQLLPDLYNYNKSQLIADFSRVYGSNFSEKDLQIVVDFLTDNLPEYPDYQ